MTLVISQNLS